MKTIKNKESAFQEKLAYRFVDQDLLSAALTHRSFSSHNNERMEFLGDALLNSVIAAELFRAQTHVSEGDLSRLRASLVRESTLAEIAQELELGQYLRLGAGEAGSHRRASVLADAFEAVLGAVYLDGGYTAVEGVIHRCFASRLADLPDPEALKDPKTRLQEALQARSLPLPEYEVLEAVGPAHKRHFRVQCRVSGMHNFTVGEGSSRRKAEQAAAEKLFQAMTDV